MRQQNTNIFANIDWLLILTYSLLVIFGWVNIYAATATDARLGIFDLDSEHGKQLLWIILSIPLIIILLFLNTEFYERFSGHMYIISITILAGVLIFGRKVNNATSWYSFGGFSLQPSEFAKAFTALGVAKLMSNREYNLKLIKNQIKVFFVIFFPAVFIALQPDMGSVLVYFAFFYVLNREGLTPTYIIIGLSSGILSILTIYFGLTITLISVVSIITIIYVYIINKDHFFLRYNWISIALTYIVICTYVSITPYIFNNVFRQHQRDRIEVLLGIKSDNKDIGYNSHQSKLTISSGGVFGKGFLEGNRTQGNFVPEQHTDYIFSVIAEEWGFIGSTIVIILFCILVLRIIYLSDKTPSKFGRIYGYSAASIFFIHFMINIGMVIGLFPTVGIPLPFFSYGGSGLWGFTILLFIFLRIDARKKNEY